MTDTPRTTHISITPVLRGAIRVYRWAVIFSFALLTVGFALTILTDHEVETEIGGPIAMLQGAADLHPAGFFGLGIGVMILAPIVMLIDAAIIFLRMGDRRYAGFTSLVALILSLSIAVAFLRG